MMQIGNSLRYQISGSVTMTHFNFATLRIFDIDDFQIAQLQSLDS